MAVLEEIGADYELKLVDAKAGQHRSPEYLRINPNGLIPMLATPDGATLFESAAILVFFCDRHPEA
ncbi:MAG: glutathione S-transferase N-terminal domain-containing protein, partial [Alphaproteobacteria bacterium]|nr:glutathione S-transferase N-terminal domain-containing protein [Alphaproteobacteria bacterium]